MISRSCQPSMAQIIQATHVCRKNVNPELLEQFRQQFRLPPQLQLDDEQQQGSIGLTDTGTSNWS